MNNLASKVGVASVSSITLTEALNLDMLWSALISLAISVVSVIAIDGLSLLKTWLKKKEKDIDDKSKGGN